MDNMPDSYTENHSDNFDRSYSTSASTCSTSPDSTSTIADLNNSVITNSDYVPLEDERSIQAFEFDSLEKVRNRLIDLSRNNNLINFKPRRSLGLMDVSLSTLYKKITNPSKIFQLKELPPLTYKELLEYLDFLDQNPEHAVECYDLDQDEHGRLIFGTRNLPDNIPHMSGLDSRIYNSAKATKVKTDIRNSSKENIETNSVPSNLETNGINTTTELNIATHANTSNPVVIDNSISKFSSITPFASNEFDHSSDEDEENLEYSEEEDRGEFGDQYAVDDGDELDLHPIQAHQVMDNYNNYQAQATLSPSIEIIPSFGDRNKEANGFVTSSLTSEEIIQLQHHQEGINFKGQNISNHSLLLNPWLLYKVVKALNGDAYQMISLALYSKTIRNNFLRGFVRGLDFSPALALKLLIVNKRARYKFSYNVPPTSKVINDLVNQINPESFSYFIYQRNHYLNLETAEEQAKRLKACKSNSIAEFITNSLHTVLKQAQLSNNEQQQQLFLNAKADKDNSDTSITKSVQTSLFTSTLSKLPQGEFKIPRSGSNLFLSDSGIRSKRLLQKFYTENVKNIREMGAGILYLTLGLLEYKDVDGKKLYAPLFLVPLEITQTKRSNGDISYSVSYTGEDLVENVSLHEKLLKDLGLFLPKLNIKENLQQELYKLELQQPSFYTHDQIEAQLVQVTNDQIYEFMEYFDLLKAQIAFQKLDCAIHEVAYLSTFQFAKQRMYMDLNPDQWPATCKLEDNPVIKNLFNERTGVKKYEIGEIKEEYDIDAIPQVHDLFPILNEADSSQHSALIDVLKGKNLVIEGPPGSGKSQTITNIIAAVMKQGKKVLFVAEKLAALDVVRRRLDEMGLGDFCLEMHDPHSLKKRVIESIAKRLDTIGKYPQCDNFNLAVQKYEQLKNSLNSYAYEINSTYKSSQFTKQQILACAGYYRKFEFKNNGLGLFDPEVLVTDSPVANNFFSKTNYHQVCQELNSFTEILLKLKSSLNRQQRYLTLQQAYDNLNLALLNRASQAIATGKVEAFNLEAYDNATLAEYPTNALATSTLELETSNNTTDSIATSLATETSSLESYNSFDTAQSTLKLKDHLWYGIRDRSLSGLDAERIVKQLFKWQSSLVAIKNFLQQLLTVIKQQQPIEFKQIPVSNNNTSTEVDSKLYGDSETSFLDDFNEFFTSSNNLSNGQVINKLDNSNSTLNLFGRELNSPYQDLIASESIQQLQASSTVSAESITYNQDSEQFKDLATNLELAQLDLHSLEILAEKFASLPIQSFENIFDAELISKLLESPQAHDSLFKRIEHDLLSIDATLHFNDPHFSELFNLDYLEAVAKAGEQKYGIQGNEVNKITHTNRATLCKVDTAIASQNNDDKNKNHIDNSNDLVSINDTSNSPISFDSVTVNHTEITTDTAVNSTEITTTIDKLSTFEREVELKLQQLTAQKTLKAMQEEHSTVTPATQFEKLTNVFDLSKPRLDFVNIQVEIDKQSKVYSLSERQNLLTNFYVANLFDSSKRAYRFLNTYLDKCSSLAQLEALQNACSVYQEKEAENQRISQKFISYLSNRITGNFSFTYAKLVKLSELLNDLPKELVKYRNANFLAAPFTAQLQEFQNVINKINYEFTSLNLEFDLGYIEDYNDFVRLRNILLNPPSVFKRIFDSDYKASQTRLKQITRGNIPDKLTLERVLARMESYFIKIEQFNKQNGFKEFFGAIFQGLDTDFKNISILRNWAEKVADFCRNELNNSELAPVIVAQLPEAEFFNLLDIGKIISQDFESLHQALTQVNTLLKSPIKSFEVMGKFIDKALPASKLLAKVLVKDFADLNLDKLLQDSIELYHQGLEQEDFSSLQSGIFTSEHIDAIANYGLSLEQMLLLVLNGAYTADFSIQKLEVLNIINLSDIDAIRNLKRLVYDKPYVLQVAANWYLGQQLICLADLVTQIKHNQTSIASSSQAIAQALNQDCGVGDSFARVLTKVRKAGASILVNWDLSSNNALKDFSGLEPNTYSSLENFSNIANLEVSLTSTLDQEIDVNASNTSSSNLKHESNQELNSIRAGRDSKLFTTGIFQDLLLLFTKIKSFTNFNYVKEQMIQLQATIAEARVEYKVFKHQTNLEESLWLGKHTNSIIDLIVRNQLALDCEDALTQWLDYLNATRKLFECHVGRISYFAEHVAKLESNTLVDIFNQIFFNYLATQVIKDSNILRDFSSLNHNAAILKFDQADIALKEAQRVHAAYCIDINRDLIPGNYSRKPIDLTEKALLDYMKEHPNLRISLRDLMFRAGQTIQSLKPCFMMSPASVAQYLTPGALEFDLMVMDEASQVTPEDALGAIARCKQVVIVGDPKQLPPTNFFGKSADSDLFEQNQSITETAESILDIATTMFPTRVLRWHYRSQHESLIAFSNRQYYNSRLIIFPSPYSQHPEYGVKFTYVDNGTFNYKKGNVEEAKVIAQAIADHLLTKPEETLGVVAMNLRQTVIIAKELDKLIATDPKLQQVYNQDQEKSEALFIKNLENVQGDERDVIFISATYGPAKLGDTKVPQRFGPINARSGGKRLNVLFTRSKKRMQIFSSMHYSDINYIASRADSGVNDFHLFLKYAETGYLESIKEVNNFEQTSSSSINYSSCISNAIGQAIQDKYTVKQEIGVTGYKLDMAFARKDNATYILGLETDGEAYVSARTARDRDRLRGMVLNRLGWKLERLWTIDWYKYSWQDIMTDLSAMLDQI